MDNLNTSYSKILTEGKNNLRTDHTINPIKVYVILAAIYPTNNGKIDDLAAIVRLAELNTMKDIDRDFIP